MNKYTEMKCEKDLLYNCTITNDRIVDRNLNQKAKTTTKRHTCSF